MRSLTSMIAILVSTPHASVSLATLNCVGVSPILQQSWGRGKGPHQSTADNASISSSPARGRSRMNPLNTIQGTIITGIVLAIVVALVVMGVQVNELSLIVWIHVLAGITWIGLLYYFNFVQVPALAAAAKDQGGPGGAGISKYVAPRALLWFRWGAVFTWLTGATYLFRTGYLLDAFTLGMRANALPNSLTIGVGAWLGTIMLFNVWVLIWPNQK